MTEVLQAFFNVDIMRTIFPAMMKGLLYTILLSAIVVPLGFIIGLGIAILSESSSRFARVMTFIYIDLFRSFPPLVLLILIFYGAPFLNIRVAPLSAAVIALVLNSSSFYAEVQRTGIKSVPKGQIEAGLSTGLSMTWTFLVIVLPQALRNVLPPLTGNTIEVIKTTAIASAVSYAELLRVAKEAQSYTFSPTPLVMAALIYFLLLWPAIRFMTRYERNLMANS